MTTFDYALSEPQAKYRYAPFVVVLTSTGLPTAGQTFVAADIKIRKAGGSLANCANFASVVDCGGGQYLYPLSTTELNTIGDLEVQYAKTGSISDLRTYVVGPSAQRDLAASATSTTVTLPSSFTSATDVYRGQFISVLSGTGVGQRRGILSQAALVLTVDRAFTTTLDAASEVEISGYDYFVAANGINYANLATDTTSALGIVRSNTAQAGAASTITLDAGASGTDNFYINNKVFIWSGTGAGQVRSFVSYVGSTKVLTVDSTWTTNPDSTSKFLLFASGSAASAAAVAAAVLGGILRTNGPVNTTVKGVLRRLDALMFGKITGFLGTTVTAYQPDGSTPEFTATQDVTLGTRSNVDKTTSET